jgi:hypothetical protein
MIVSCPRPRRKWRIARTDRADKGRRGIQLVTEIGILLVDLLMPMIAEVGASFQAAKLKLASVMVTRRISQFDIVAPPTVAPTLSNMQ